MDAKGLVVKNYNKLLTELKTVEALSSYQENINAILNNTDENKIAYSLNFALSIDNTTNFNYILKSKIKVFSHKSSDTLKISTSLFNDSELTLKKVFNNQDESIKDLLWSRLHKLLLQTKKLLLEEDKTNKKLQEDIDKLESIIKENKESLNPQNYINKLIDAESLNESTNEMINDIVNSFQDAFTDNTGNPFQNIMKINELISDKYKDKIENGDIDLTQIMGSLQKSLPGLGEMGGIGEILSTVTQTEKPKETIIMDENFSTADIQIGELEDDKPNLMIGNMIKSVGSLAGGIGGSGEGLPDLSKFMNVFSKLGSADNVNPEELQNLFANDLGIDMNKLAEQMTEVLKDND